MRCLMAMVICLTVAGGCCFLPLSAGTWEDDEGNWRRAFRTAKPDDVVVVRSWYWRSAHWTYEYEFYFELEQNEPLREEMISFNELVLRTDNEGFTRGHQSPEWFAPKELSEYEIWEAQGNDNLALLMDKETGHLFLRDWQF
jgi:hypothetical protein